MIAYWVVAVSVVTVAVWLGVEVGIGMERRRWTNSAEEDRLTAPLPPERKALDFPPPVHRRASDTIVHPTRTYRASVPAVFTVNVVEPVRTEILVEYQPRHVLHNDPTVVVSQRDGEFTQELKRAGLYQSAALVVRR